MLTCHLSLLKSTNIFTVHLHKRIKNCIKFMVNGRSSRKKIWPNRNTSSWSPLNIIEKINNSNEVRRKHLKSRAIFSNVIVNIVPLTNLNHVSYLSSLKIKIVFKLWGRSKIGLKTILTHWRLTKAKTVTVACKLQRRNVFQLT